MDYYTNSQKYRSYSLSKELACIIITNNNIPADDLIEAAKQENIPIITTSMTSFDTAGNYI